MTAEPAVEPERLTLRLKEVAAMTGVGLSTVKAWCQTGQLVSVRIGGVVLIKPQDLRDFLDAHREGNHIAPPQRLRVARSK